MFHLIAWPLLLCLNVEAVVVVEVVDGCLLVSDINLTTEIFIVKPVVALGIPRSIVGIIIGDHNVVF